jgi:hypothetical protein
MKNPILRILIKASLVSLAAGSLVMIIGLTREWKTSLEFSNGFFWAGAILIFMGLISFQGYSRGSMDAPAAHLDTPERSGLSVEDASRGKSLMVLLGTSGLLLFILSFLVARLF